MKATKWMWLAASITHSSSNLGEKGYMLHNLSKQSGPPTKSCWNLLREFSETSCSFGHKSVEYRHFHPKNRNFHVLCNQMEWSPWKATELEGCLLCLCVDRKNIHYFTQLFVNKFPQRCIEFICQGLFCQWNLRIFKQTVVFLLTWFFIISYNEDFLWFHRNWDKLMHFLIDCS